MRKEEEKIMKSYVMKQFVELFDVASDKQI